MGRASVRFEAGRYELELDRRAAIQSRLSRQRPRVPARIQLHGCARPALLAARPGPTRGRHRQTVVHPPRWPRCQRDSRAFCRFHRLRLLRCRRRYALLVGTALARPPVASAGRCCHLLRGLLFNEIPLLDFTWRVGDCPGQPLWRSRMEFRGQTSSLKVSQLHSDSIEAVEFNRTVYRMDIETGASMN